MKKKILLAVMAATSLGSLQASSYLRTTFAVLNNLSTKDKVILTAGAAALAVAAYSLQQKEILKKQQKEKLKALRVEVDKERLLLETDTNEDRKQAFIQRIAKLQSNYDAFIIAARTLYYTTSDSAVKANILPLVNKATTQIEKLTHLMSYIKQRLDATLSTFNQNLEPKRKQLKIHERIYSEVNNSLKSLHRKTSPAIL